MKLAIAHDWLNQRGGAEDVLEALVDAFPNSPIFTSFYAPERMPPEYRQWDIRALWTNRLPGIARAHMRYLPFYPLAWAGCRPRGFDALLSNKSGFCHGLRTPPDMPHVCYCLTPTRYLWQYDEYMAQEGYPPALVASLRPLIALLRRWDYAAAQRVTRFIAISTTVQERIRRLYCREASIIHPPVDVDRFAPVPSTEVGEYLLVVSRLIPYKRIDLAVRAATALGMPLKIAGHGRDERRLRSLAGPTVEFLGYVADAELPALFARCRALLFPGLEDFGIVPVQAQAAGRPVIAYAGGGALDTVEPGISGELFAEQTADCLVETLRQFDASAYVPSVLRERAARFSRERFLAAIRDVVGDTCLDFRMGEAIR